MKLTSIEVLNRFVYIGFGLLLGFQVAQSWLQSENNTASSKEVIVEQHVSALSDVVDLEPGNNINSYDIDNRRISDAELRLILADIIREEIRNQVIPLIASSNNDQPDNMSASNDPGVQQRASMEQEFIYNSAIQLIDETISVGELNPTYTSQLNNHLGKLTPEQVFSIRTKLANAVNEGLIAVSLPLGMVMEDQYQ